MRTTIKIATLGNGEPVTTTVEHPFPLSAEWLARNGAEVVA